MSENIQIHSILIIRLTSIGDVLLATPLIRVLRNLYPTADIDFLTSTQTKDVVLHNPQINNLYHLDRKSSLLDLKAFKTKFLSGKRYDIIIDLQKNLKSAILSSGLSDRVIRFNKRRLLKLRMVCLKKKLTQIDLIPELYINTVASLGGAPDDKPVEFWLNSDVEMGEYSPKNNYQMRSGIIIAPGAYHFTKRWPLQRFTELCLKINLNYPNLRITIVGGKEDAESGTYLQKNSNVTNRAGELSLIGTAELINNSQLVISNDTAVMHFAASRLVPVIALFGSTVQDFGFAPYHSEHIIIEKDVSCRPCTHFGKSKCPKKHFNCMNFITTDEVYRAVELFLKNS